LLFNVHIRSIFAASQTLGPMSDSHHTLSDDTAYTYLLYQTCLAGSKNFTPGQNDLPSVDNWYSNYCLTHSGSDCANKTTLHVLIVDVRSSLNRVYMFFRRRSARSFRERWRNEVTIAEVASIAFAISSTRISGTRHSIITGRPTWILECSLPASIFRVSILKYAVWYEYIVCS